MVGKADKPPNFNFEAGQLDRGSPSADFEKNDLINFKQDVAGAEKSSTAPEVITQIDLESDVEWPPGQGPQSEGKSPQIKRKLENPEFKIVTANLIQTDHGSKIILEGVEDLATLSDDQIEFIRGKVKEVLLHEIAASKTWGKLPPIQATFQLGIGMYFFIISFFHLL
jgi:hypothetical protein